VEPVDVAGRVVDGIVKLNRIRAAVRQRKKHIPARVGDSGPEPAQRVGRYTILQVICESGNIDPGTVTGLVQRADSE
jgi:hypothetical protein